MAPCQIAWEEIFPFLVCEASRYVDFHPHCLGSVRGPNCKLRFCRRISRIQFFSPQIGVLELDHEPSAGAP